MKDYGPTPSPTDAEAKAFVHGGVIADIQWALDHGHLIGFERSVSGKGNADLTYVVTIRHGSAS